MITKGIRGAITVENNSVEAIRCATLELLNELTAQNNLEPDNISHAIFTLTNDLNAEFPAKFARLDLFCDFCHCRVKKSSANIWKFNRAKFFISVFYHFFNYTFTVFCS